MKSLAIFSSILALSACSKQQQHAAEQPPPVVEHVAVSDRDVVADPAVPSDADGVSRDPALATNSPSDASRTTTTTAGAATTNSSGAASGSTTAAATPAPSPASAPDNTDVNKRDRKAEALTPIDQGNNEKDLKITQEIRQSLMKDSSLSFNAKNVKIITVGGKVTLRGPVKTMQERATIEAAARRIAGGMQVDNQIEVK